MDIAIRQATPDDAPFIVWTVLSAMGLEPGEIAMPESICRERDTLYSYCRARVAMAGNRVAGCLVSYPGSDYGLLRNRTWSLFPGFDAATMPQSDPETDGGEYYLDSMAVHPDFRGLGIGHALMRDALVHAESQGWEQAGLIVEQDAPRLQAYYALLGFEGYGRMKLFGHPYNRMRISLSKNNKAF